MLASDHGLGCGIGVVVTAVRLDRPPGRELQFKNL
jgi:hypothetical protein